MAGGTKVAAAFQLVNEIVKRENLSQNYNIYVFYGTDGDDWDTDGKECLPEIEAVLQYAARLGVTIVDNGYGGSRESEVQKYLQASGLLEKQRRRIRLDLLPGEADEQRVIEGIRQLINP